MTCCRLIEGSRQLLLGVVAALVVADASSSAQAPFPFGRELILDAAPLQKGKRMPAITIAENGAVAIDLWCRSATGQVEFNESAIRIAAGPLPDALPSVMGRDQCTPARIEADQDLLAALTQATSWRMQGNAVVLEGGPKAMKFRPATN
jgi:heat shock protein HslJ